MFTSQREPIKILYVNHGERIAGAERCLMRILENIDRTRFEPVLACPKGQVESAAASRGASVHTFEFVDYQRNHSSFCGRRFLNPLLALFHLVWLVFIGWKLGRLARQCDVRLIHANTLLSRLPALLGGLISRTPVVWHIRDILPQGIWTRIYDWAARHGVKRIILVSEACRSQFSEQSRIVTVYDGISTEVFSPREPAARRLRAQWGWSGDEVVFGIFGRITPWKGHGQFVDAALGLHRRYPSVRCLVVGETWSDEDRAFLTGLKDIISADGLLDKFVFTGFRDDIPELMSVSDVVVVPSIQPDPFPNTVLEGMSCAKAVVAFPVGGIPEAIEDGICGKLVPEKDATGLARVMEELIIDPSLRAALGINARKRVQEKFGVARNQQEIEKVYEEVLSQHRS